MSHTDQNRLFQRFARFGTPADKQSGVGLGMVFVKAVLDRHRGQITLDSTPGQGSTFTLTLPAQN
jgi:signal transduction histidine kinase